MRITRFLLAITLLLSSGGFTAIAQAAEGMIRVKSIAEIEVTTVGKDGKKSVKRTPVTTAIPGTEVIFTNSFENTGNKAATDLVLNNPIPNDMEYKGGSAFGKDCIIVFSADGGRNFGAAENIKVKDAEGKEHTALPREYTHIRWTLKAQLSPGTSSDVGFRAVVK